MSEVYVAYSIHGSYCFITANKQNVKLTGSAPHVIDGIPFTVGRSRDGSNLRGSTKLLCDELEDQGRPTSNPQIVIDFFQRLRDAGWTVDDAAFMKKHGVKPSVKATPELPVPPAEEAPAKVSKKKGKSPTPKAKAPEDKSAETTTPESPADKPVEAATPETLVETTPIPQTDNPSSEDDPNLPEAVAKDETGMEQPVEKSAEEASAPVKDRSEGDASGITCVKGDIVNVLTTDRFDAVINAANKELVPGGGVDGALNRAAGPKLAEAMAALNGCATGSAKATLGFDLPVDHVIHAVGPVYDENNIGDSADLLRSAYRAAFDGADYLGDKKIVSPLLSTGVYHYPLDAACGIAVAEAVTAISRYPGTQIVFVAFDDAALEALKKAVAAI